MPEARATELPLEGILFDGGKEHGGDRLEGLSSVSGWFLSQSGCLAAARAEAVHFHMLHKKDLSRVKEVWYCVEENKPIERSRNREGL